MKSISYIFPFAAIIFLAFYSLKAEKTPLDNEKKKISYALGYQVGQGFKQQDVAKDIDVATLQLAIKDVLTGSPSLMNEEEVKTYMKKWYEIQLKKREQAAGDNLKKGQEFLEANKAKEGIKTTESGLQYQMVTEGKGDAPKPTDKVTVHYKGVLIDGTEFDSSYKRNQPATFGLNQVIKGWTEGLQLIKPGGKIKLFIPPELGYGAVPRPTIPANSVLIFDVELIEIAE